MLLRTLASLALLTFALCTLHAQDPAAVSPPAPEAALEVPPAAPVPTPVPEIQKVARQDDPDYYMVAIEALVVEINEERTRDLGLRYGSNSQGPINPLTGVTSDNAPSSIFDGSNISLGRALNPVRVPILLKGLEGRTDVLFQDNLMPGLGLSLVGMNVGSQVVSARLRALLSQGEATVRTRPIAVALNGTRAQIMATDEIPYQDARSAVGLDVKFEKVGVKMAITPTIVSLRPGVATLDIANLEVSSVANFVTTSDADRPIFNRSHTNTKVTLAEGETFVVGGLKTRRNVTYRERLPVLGAIPLVGLLFSSQSTVERNRDVLFFITPSILQPGENFLLPFDFKNQQALGIDIDTVIAEK